MCRKHRARWRQTKRDKAVNLDQLMEVALEISQRYVGVKEGTAARQRAVVANGR